MDSECSSAKPDFDLEACKHTSNAVQSLLEQSRHLVSKCDAAHSEKLEPLQMRKDKQNIWEKVRSAEAELGKTVMYAESHSDAIVLRHGELCDAEASLLDIASDFEEIAVKGLDQSSRAKKHSEKIVYASQVEHGAAEEYFAASKPTWLTMMENTIDLTENLGYKADTGWRKKVSGFLNYLIHHFRREPFGGDSGVMDATIGDTVVVSKLGTASSKSLEQVLHSLPPESNRRIIYHKGNDTEPMMTIVELMGSTKAKPGKGSPEVETFILKHESIEKSKDLGCRSEDVCGELIISHRFCPSDLERPAAAITRTLKNVLLVLNTMSKGRVVEALVDLKEQASNLESAFNDDFRVARNKYLETAAKLKHDKQEHKNIMRAIHVEISSAKEMLATAFIRAQEMLKTYEVDCVEGKTLDVGKTFLPKIRSALQKQGKNKKSAQFKVLPRQNMVLNDLMATCRLGAEREQRIESRGRFHRILLECSNAGAWQEALHAFACMISIRVPPTRDTFHLLIRTCRRSTPSQPALAVAMLRKMRAMGVATNEKTFLLTMATCGERGNHRMLAAAFRDMIETGWIPTTGTYESILKICDSGKIPADEAPQLYESLRLGGVPERIAFTGASMCLKKGKVRGRLHRGLNMRGSIF